MNARLGFINPADVERIEVIKGPVSALYSSGSTGGVVNIITRKAKFTDGLEAHGRLAGSGSSNPGAGSAYGNFSVSGVPTPGDSSPDTSGTTAIPSAGMIPSFPTATTWTIRAGAFSP
jgi:outer membrane receptor for ferrienterochelin and colicin